MDTGILQYLIQKNSDDIRMLDEYLKCISYKYKRCYDDMPMPSTLRNRLSSCRKRLARYAAVQTYLKKELAYNVLMYRSIGDMLAEGM